MGGFIVRGLSSLVAAAGLILAGAGASPAGASAASTGDCAAAPAGQVDCGTLTTPGSIAVSANAQAAAATPPAGFGPADLRGAYGLPSGTAGAGQTVAIVTAFDDATAAADLATYRSQFSLAACTAASGCFSKVDETGGTNLPPAGPAGWSLAAAQSMDMISAICPQCHILLVEATSTDLSDLGAAENEAVTRGAKFVTNTWFTAEETNGTGEPALDSLYFDHPGVVITAADGNGAGFGTSYPAASPNVIAVGGTTLTGSAASGWTETAWAGSGSGCSPFEAKPSWQSDTGCSGRMLNDISAVADPSASPVAFFDASSGGWVTGGGDNVAAAIVASAFALAGTPATTSSPASYLYGSPGGLRDITTGSNGTCSPAPAYFCAAGTGYDGPTGLGTPHGVSAMLSSYYQPVTPARILDTRSAIGAAGPLASGGTVHLQVTGAHGVPTANVTAVAITVAAVSETSSGFLSAYPDGTPRPATSSLNFVTGTTVSNQVIVPVGANGKIAITNESPGTTQLLGDISGYFTSDAAAVGDTTYTPVTPARILDTRTGIGAPAKILTPGTNLAVPVAGAHGIPVGVSAVAINLTATDETAPGFLEGFADGTAVPNASGLQFPAHTIIAGLAIVPVGADGKIDIHVGGGGNTNVIGDVAGYFAPGTAGEKYHAITATRLVDTRQGTKPVAAMGTLGVAQGAAVAAPAATLVLNVTAVDGSAGGFVVSFAAGAARPATSSVNYGVHDVHANQVLAMTGGGVTDLFNSSAGTVQLVVDCLGYFSG